MRIRFDNKTNIAQWNTVVGATIYEISMTGGTPSNTWIHSEWTHDTRLSLSTSKHWGNIKETGVELEVVAYDNSTSSALEVGRDTINITIPKPPWHHGAAVRILIILAVLLGIWVGYSQYRLGGVNDVSQRLSESETLVTEKLTVISNLTTQLENAKIQPKETNYVIVRIEERVKVYDIPQGMPSRPATNETLVTISSPASKHTVPKVVADGDGTVFRTPNGGWTVNCIVYGHEDDFDRLVNIGGITNPQWIHYGPKTKLPPNVTVVAYWIRNRVPNSNIKVEFVLTPVAPAP